MNNKRISFRQREKRLLLLLSAFIVTILAIPSLRAMASSTGGGSLELKLNKVYIYEWQRVYSNDQLPGEGKDFKFIASWDHNNRIYGTIGYGNEDENNNDGVECHIMDTVPWYNRSADVFYSPDDLNAFDARSQGTDGDNGGARKVKVATSKGHGLYAEWMVGKDEFRYKGSLGESTSWTVITHDAHGSYAAPASGSVKIIYNSAGDDIVMAKNGDRLMCQDEDRGATTFILHAGTKIWYDAITSDLTVPTGTTLSVPNGVMLSSGVTLTVEPGAVLLIEGKFIANGVIKNYGTVLVADGGLYEPFCPEQSNSGLIFCYGGSTRYFCNSINKSVPAEGHLIVMPGGKMHFAEGHGMIILYKGAVCVNFGEMTLPDDIALESATFENRKGGKVTTGRPEAAIMGIVYNRNQLKSLGLIKGINCRNTDCTIINSGSWDNYSEITGSGASRISGVKSF